MSGIEVVGLVLGVIPLILEGIKKYQSMKDYSGELKALTRDLQTEYVLLQDTCETLLISIKVPNAKIRDYLEDPFGDLWKGQEIQVSLRQRLWKSYGLFEEIVQEMKSAVDQLGQRFGVMTEAGAIAAKKRSEVSLFDKLSLYSKRHQIRDLQNNIKNGNRTLKKLLATSVDKNVEASHSSQSRGRYLTLTQQCSSNALTALETSICCQCRPGHSLNLKLPSLSSNVTPADNDEDIVKGVVFEVTFASIPSGNEGIPCCSQWKDLELHTHIWEQKKSARAEVASTLNNKFTKKNTQTTVCGSSFLCSEPMEITNLCCAVDSACGATTQIDCYGLIKAESTLSKHYFRVKPGQRHHSRFDSQFGKSLEYLISCRSHNVVPWRLRHKHVLAIKVASSVLQFSQSQWLPNFLTTADIAFMETKDPSFFEYPFMIKRLQTDEVAYQHIENGASGLPHDLLFSLGVVLLEVALEQSLDSLRHDSEISSTTADRDLLADYELAIKNLKHVKLKMGTPYWQAVKYCLKCEFMSPVLDLGEDGFREEVYRKVVAPLEKIVSYPDMKFKAF